MSQSGIIRVQSQNLPPTVPTTFTTDSGVATPVSHNINILGNTGSSLGHPVVTTGSGATINVEVQIAEGIAAADATKIGLAAFDTASFAVDSDGFVTFIGAPGSSPLTTKGDLYTYSTTNTRLPIGSDSSILMADSAQTTGNKWTTATYPNTTTANQLLYSSSSNTIAGLTSGNNGVLITSGAGVPSISSTLPSAVQGNITSVGTITSGVWNGTAIDATHGGTNQTTWTTGDLLYASGANTLAKLPIGSSTNVLTVTGGVPVWAAAPASGVSSVSGTANRITSTGGATPVIDISASYVGQSSITTLGTIATGVWNGTAIDATHGGTAQTTWATGDLLYASGANTLSKLAIGSSTNVLTVTGGVPVWAAAPATGVTSVSGTTNRITSTGGTTPVIDISASYVGQSSITTLGTVTTGVWNGTAVDVSHGGTGDTSFTAYAVVTGGTTSTGALQNVSGVGTSGQVLTSAGASALPTWSNNAMVLVQSQNASTSSTIDFTTISSSYRYMKFILTDILMTGGNLAIRVSTDGGSTYQATNYGWVSQLWRSDAATDFGRSNSDVYMNTNRSIASTPRNLNAELDVFNINNATYYIAITGFLTTYDGSGAGISAFTGQWLTATAVTAIRFLSTTGSTIASGNIALYGIN